MDVEFSIPSEPEALLVADSSATYQVQTDTNPANLSAAELVGTIEDVTNSIGSRKPLGIVENFDVVFGLSRNFTRLSSSHRKALFLCIQRGVSALHVLLTTTSDPDEVNKREARNALRMYTYVLSLIAASSEDEALTANNLTVKTSKKKASKSDQSWDWQSHRIGCVKALQQLTSSVVDGLWQRSPEPEFVNLLSRSACKFLENPAVLKDSDTKQFLFLLLGSIFKRLKQSVLGVTTSVLHLLSHFEHLVLPLAELVGKLVTEFDGQSVLTELVREIGRNDPKELAQDTGGTRNIAGFLTELGARVPAAILKSGGISVLLPHLNGEAYNIRNAILSILTDVIITQTLNQTEDDSDSQKKMREQAQDILEDRIHDTSAYVRAKALQMWGKMAAVEAPDAAGDNQEAAVRSVIPRTRLPAIVQLTASRLRDKSSMVRKEALRVMTTLIVRNPYGPQLAYENWKEKLEDATQALGVVAADLLKSLQMQNEERKDGAADEKSSKNGGAKDSEAEDADESSGDDASETEDAVDEAKEEPAVITEESPEVKMAKLKFVFFREGALFAEKLQETMPIVSDLLGSKNVSDVKEAILFIESANRYAVGNACVGVRKMLSLIWSKEESVKEAVLDAYSRLFLTAKRPEAIANSLVQLTHGCNLGELTSLEEMVCILMRTDRLPGAAIKALWAMFSMKGSVTAEQSIRALIVLGQAAQADPSIIKRNAGLLVSIGFGPRAHDSMSLVEYSCVALQKLAPVAKKGQKATEAVLYDAKDDLFSQLVNAVVRNDEDEIPGWFAAAEQAINTVYLLSENPDSICTQIIQRLCCNVFPDAATAKPAQVARVLFVVGHVALKQLVHLEKIEGEVKRRVRLQEEKEKKNAKDKNSDEDDIVGGAAAIDNVGEAMAAIAENKLVLGDGLLAAFGKVLIEICAHPEKYSDRAVRTTAVLSLTKFMCVSSGFAEQNLQLLFTLMQNAPEPEIRANCVLAMGDLAFRFANLLEPWTSHMYGRLRDSDVKVRKNAVMVLTHLILNDMIKVKGQVSEMAIRLEDDVERVQNLARLFFLEVSHKGNAIYNMLPDVISHLAHEDSGLKPDQFKRIMDYLMTFITKGAHCVSLVEKLCYRFRTTQEVQQWRYFAHCLSLLQYNDKAVKKLLSQISCFQDTLFDETVFNSFLEITAKAKKFASAELKETVCELEERLVDIHNKGADDANAAQKASKMAKRVAKVKGSKDDEAGTRKPLRQSQSSRQRGKGKASSGGENQEPDVHDAAPTKVQASKAKQQRRRRVVAESEDDEDFMI